MAWYAELLRRNWYCIVGIDMISWYSEKLYDEWYSSLTEEQRAYLKECENERRIRSYNRVRNMLLYMHCFGMKGDDIDV